MVFMMESDTIRESILVAAMDSDKGYESLLVVTPEQAERLILLSA